jgi:hypothetical protein
MRMISYRLSVSLLAFTAGDDSASSGSSNSTIDGLILKIFHALKGYPLSISSHNLSLGLQEVFKELPNRWAYATDPS